MLSHRLFSTRVGYAVHALCLLAQKRPLAAISLAELALEMARTWPGTSATYLSKVVQALVQGGILVSLRGSAGGYGFARPPAELSLLQVIGALEGPLDTHCPLSPTGPCMLRGRCPNQLVLEQLQSEVSALLARLTIERLAANLTHLQHDSKINPGPTCPGTPAFSEPPATIFTPETPASLAPFPCPVRCAELNLG